MESEKLTLLTDTLWKTLVEVELDGEEQQLHVLLESRGLLDKTVGAFNHFGFNEASPSCLEYFCLREAEILLDELEEATVLRTTVPRDITRELIYHLNSQFNSTLDYQENSSEQTVSPVVVQWQLIMQDFVRQLMNTEPREETLGIVVLYNVEDIICITPGRSIPNAMQNLLREQKFEGTWTEYKETLVGTTMRTFAFEFVRKFGEWISIIEGGWKP